MLLVVHNVGHCPWWKAPYDIYNPLPPPLCFPRWCYQVSQDNNAIRIFSHTYSEYQKSNILFEKPAEIENHPLAFIESLWCFSCPFNHSEYHKRDSFLAMHVLLMDGYQVQDRICEGLIKYANQSAY